MLIHRNKVLYQDCTIMHYSHMHFSKGMQAGVICQAGMLSNRVWLYTNIMYTEKTYNSHIICKLYITATRPLNHFLPKCIGEVILYLHWVNSHIQHGCSHMHIAIGSVFHWAGSDSTSLGANRTGRSRSPCALWWLQHWSSSQSLVSLRRLLS